jgi:N-acyl homoserine lactone hydrolase
LIVGVICLLSIAAGRRQTPHVRMYVLDGGHAVLKDSSLLNDTEEPSSGPVELADPCFLIRHGRQWLLWDTGLPDSLVGHPESSPMIRLEKARSMTDQLQQIGLKPRQVDYLAFSHLHYDHTGTANLFKSATWILQRVELQYALGLPAPFSVVQSSFGAYRHAKKLEITGDYDVFGDGTVRILLTPGHTPGHECLLVRLAHEGPVLLSGDLFHQRISFEEGWVPRINANRSETLASIARVRDLIKNVHARLVIQHDPQDFAALPKPPTFLE